MAGRLEEIAVPIFTRQERFGSDKAAAIRLTALCLAGEEALSTLGDDTDLRATFQEIAAGVTLLERRLSGQAPATETILVALA